MSSHIMTISSDSRVAGMAGLVSNEIASGALRGRSLVFFQHNKIGLLACYQVRCRTAKEAS